MTRADDHELYTMRQKLASWHFSQEQLSSGEREILHVAEWLLRRLDARDREDPRT